MTRLRARIALAGMAALLLAAAGVASPAVARDQLVIGVSQFPTTLNPELSSSLASSYVLQMTRRPVTAFDAKWQLICMLCVTLPSFENGLAQRVTLPNGKEGVKLTYTLQPNATWGDGVPVSTEDVLFTYEVGRDPKSGVPDAELFRRIVSIEVKDAKTFTLTRDRIDYQYQALDDFAVLPVHLERAAFADPASYRFRTLYVTDPTNAGLYFGPYRVSELLQGSRVVLERNPTWWGKPAAFKRIVLSLVENTAALETNLLAGNIDMISGELGSLSTEQALAIERRYGDRFTVTSKPGLNYSHIDVNLDNPILADLRVRQALLYGLDRKGISETLLGGKAPVADTIVHPLDWVWTDDVRHYPYDPRRARGLLDEAGWSVGEDGIRRNASGTPLEVNLAAGSGNRLIELVEQVMQSEWREIGITLHLHNEPARVLFDELPKRKFEMVLFGWISAPENVPRTILNSTEIPSPDNGYSGQNFGGYRNPEMDQLMDEIEITLDRDRRAELWRRLQRLYADTLPELPLYFRADSYVLPKWLEGVTPTGHLDTSALWVEDWHDASGVSN